MFTFPGLALLVIKSLLGVISQILDQVAALKKQIAAFQERLAELRNQIASLKAQLDQAHRRAIARRLPSPKTDAKTIPNGPGANPARDGSRSEILPTPAGPPSLPWRLV